MHASAGTPRVALSTPHHLLSPHWQGAPGAEAGDGGPPATPFHQLISPRRQQQRQRRRHARRSTDSGGAPAAAGAAAAATAAGAAGAAAAVAAGGASPRGSDGSSSLLPSPRRTSGRSLTAWRLLSPSNRLFGWRRWRSAPEEGAGDVEAAAASAPAAVWRTPQQELAALPALLPTQQQAEAGGPAACAGAGAANGTATANGNGGGNAGGGSRGGGGVAGGLGRASSEGFEGNHEPPTWHHLPSRSGQGGPALQEEALWVPPDAATLAKRFPPTLYLPPAPPKGRVAAALAAVQRRTGTCRLFAITLHRQPASNVACPGP